ncbi:hypothetical protein NX059_002873 [Plenodomus lindquistii]|nr:hypothetical protein NX059_002873 [Plenodomus lindquistii]
MGWHERIVYHRDFAYDARRSRMAHGSIGDVPAGTFAEYVDAPFLDELSQQDDDHVRRAPVVVAQKTPASPSRCIALRPGLTHRLYSHRLHVRAKAKWQRDRLLSGPMVDVYVGPAKRHWSLHRNLLCHHSELLEDELHGSDRGGDQAAKLELPEHDPAGFELLVKWLYQGRLDDVSDLADANQKYEYAVSCHKLYLLCDRFDMMQLKNVAMDQYRKGLHEAELVPDADEIDDIYRNSPKASPFRHLMTRIAARQIMDPGSDRDVETYRQCFENNPDFAVDLVKAIRLGTGGVLFDDPTEQGHNCDYHDHDTGPNCYSKANGKAKIKPAKKKPRPPPQQPAPISASANLPANSNDQPPLPPHLPPPKASRPAPPRPVRPHDGANGGGLQRRLTSPASSTVGTSMETVTASQPPSPDTMRDRQMDLEKLRRVTPSQRRTAEQNQVGMVEMLGSLPARDAHRPSSDDMSRPVQGSDLEVAGAVEAVPAERGQRKKAQRTPSRGIWEWARAGTGRLSSIGRLAPEWNGPASTKSRTSTTIPESHDDFSIPSSTTTQLENGTEQQEAAAAKLESLGIVHPETVPSPFFAQTKRSSDELVAASSTASTPANLAMRTENWTYTQHTTPSAATGTTSPTTPDTPTPQQRRRDAPLAEEATPTKDAPNGTTPAPDARKNISIDEHDFGSGSAESKSATRTTTPQMTTNGERSQTTSPRATTTPKSTSRNGNGSTPVKLRSASTTPKTGSASPHPVAKYKIALVPSLMAPAKSTAST